MARCGAVANGTGWVHCGENGLVSWLDGVEPLAMFNLVLMLAMGHFVADFALQGDRMAVEKCPGQGVVLGWGWWLCAHAAIHGFFVAWITGVPLLGLAEWLVHSLIDLGKCRRRYGMGIDQCLHLVCKVVWALVAVTWCPGAGLTP